MRTIIALILLIPLLSLAQVTIKEKVEIKPKVKPPSMAAVELKITFRWAAERSTSNHMMHLGVLDPGSRYGGFDPYTGSKSGNYTEVITDDYENSYYGESRYIISNALSGTYFLYGIHDLETIWINYMYYYSMHIEAAGFVDTVIYLKKPDWTRMYELPYVVNGIMFSFFGPPPPPCGGAHFEFLEIQDVQHGEVANIWAPIRNDCGNNVSEPPEYYYKYALSGDAVSSGYLRDPNNPNRVGTVLDSVASTIVEFVAWGDEPASEKQVTISVSAENGSITPATTTFTLLPPQARVLAGKTTVSYGDTTLLTMEVRYPENPWMTIPEDWTTSYQVVEGGSFGFLYPADSSYTDTYISGYYPDVRYYGIPDPTHDSASVLIQLVVREWGGGGGDVRAGLPATSKQSTFGQLQRSNPSQLTASPGSKGRRSALVSNGYDTNTHYGLIRLDLKKYEILLGQTKYYYVLQKSDGTKSIEATPDPVNPGVQNDVWHDDALAVLTDKPNSGKRAGVYWEKKSPDGKALPTGMIRLIGRYWAADSLYKVNLTAIHEGTLNINIEVKKPSKLIDWDRVGNKPDFANGNDYSQTIDAFRRPLNIDDMVIDTAGRYGIPPQIIKGQMYQESFKGSSGDLPRFYPSYRYEPWQDLYFAKRYQQTNDRGVRLNDYLDQPFVVTEGSMGSGRGIPTHTGVRPVGYQLTPMRIGNYVVSNWSLYFNNSKERFVGKDYDSDPMNKWWKNLKAYYLSKFKGDDGKAINATTADVQSTIITYCPAWAQTRKSASYGIIQLTYEEAKTKGYQKGKPKNDFGTWNVPEDLNDQNVAMPFYVRVTLSNLQSLFGSGIPASMWSPGFESAWEKAIAKYNKYKQHYGAEVLTNSKMFLPKSN